MLDFQLYVFRCVKNFIPMLAAITAVLGSNAAGAADPKPWTHQNYDERPEDFTFAVISDLTGGERPGIFNVAVADLNLIRPAFVMGLGDLIEGGTYIDEAKLDEKEVVRQWEVFDARVKKIIAPFYYVVGNHDISNAMMQGIWERRFGHRYYHFVYKNTLFLMLDSEDFDHRAPAAAEPTPGGKPTLTQQWEKKRAYLESESAKGNRKPLKEFMAQIDWDGNMGGGMSEAQVAYFKKAIADNAGVRWTFLFLHRPMWQGDGNEGLRQIETALHGRPFMTFAGHNHNYKYFEQGQQIHIRLGTTGAGWFNKNEKGNFDHLMLVRMTQNGPSIVNLRLDGILDKTGRIPAEGEMHCFSETACWPATASQ